MQLAVFVGGGILGPVWHLAHHQNDHTHEADERAIAFDLGAAEEPAHGHPHAPDVEASTEAVAEADAHPHRNAHPHLHAQAQPHRRPHTHSYRDRHALSPASPDPTLYAEPHEQAAPVPRPSGRPEATPLPTPLGHGHASIAHFGLALLGAPALLPVPAPERGEWLSIVARTAALGLFHPSFPLPRPPPPARSA